MSGTTDSIHLACLPYRQDHQVVAQQHTLVLMVSANTVMWLCVRDVLVCVSDVPNQGVLLCHHRGDGL